MTFEQTLRTVIKHLNSGDLNSEAAVKLSVILPVLTKLGWDVADPNSFKPEFAVESGFVDFALLDHGKPLVFIEAKHVGVKVGKGEEQLFGYAANKGVPLLVLTNGWYWDFYLSMAAGPPPDRRFYSLDLHLEDKVPVYVDILERYLLQERVVSGKARLDAEDLNQSIWERKKARDTIPDAWRKLVEERDESLRNLLAKCVQRKCGAKPDFGDVDAFLTSLQPRGKKIEHKPSPSGGHAIPSPVPTGLEGPFKVKGFILRGNRVVCKTAISTLAEVLNSFQRENSGFMDRLAPRTARPKRRLVARNHVDLYEDARLAKKYRKLDDGWFLGTHYGSRSIRRYIKIACEEAEVKFGDQLKLIEE